MKEFSIFFIFLVALFCSITGFILITQTAYLYGAFNVSLGILNFHNFFKLRSKL